MPVANMLPNHILILGPSNSGKLRIASHITGDEPDEVPDSSHCGIIQRTSISTKYYTMDLSILIDEYPETKSKDHSQEDQLKALANWVDEFKGDDCKELRDVLDGVIITIDETIAEEILNEISNLRDLIRKGQDAFVCVVDMKGSDEVEDIVILNGFEYIRFDESGKNEYNEAIGKDRLTELIQTHEWLEMERSPLTDDKTDSKTFNEYEESKKSKVNQMMKGLLEQDSDDESPTKMMDLNLIFQKLQLAKINVGDMTDVQREEYANKLIEEIIDYI